MTNKKDKDISDSSRLLLKDKDFDKLKNSIKDIIKKRETIDDKLIEVTEQEYLTGIYGALKDYEQQIETIKQDESTILQALQDIKTYKGLNYKIVYYWNDKESTYSFRNYMKNKPGFKK